MEAIGYVVKDVLGQAQAQALTYGSQADMEAWAALNAGVDPTTALYQVKPGDDVQRAMVDQPYFQSLVDG